MRTDPVSTKTTAGLNEREQLLANDLLSEWSVLTCRNLKPVILNPVTTGKLVQIEHALAAVNQGTTSLGIKARDGVVLATEKKVPLL